MSVISEKLADPYKKGSWPDMAYERRDCSSYQRIDFTKEKEANAVTVYKALNKRCWRKAARESAVLAILPAVAGALTAACVVALIVLYPGLSNQYLSILLGGVLMGVPGTLFLTSIPLERLATATNRLDTVSYDNQSWGVEVDREAAYLTGRRKDAQASALQDAYNEVVDETS